MSRLDEIEKRLEAIEKELGCERAKPAQAPATDFLHGPHDWRSDPDLYRKPGLQWNGKVIC